MTTTGEMQRARLSGAELEYELGGAGEPVLLIHGSHVARSFELVWL